MIGGEQSFAGGQWGQSQLAAALPVETGAQLPLLEGPVKIVPTEQGLAEGPMRISSDGNDPAAWQRLKPLPQADRLGGPKPAATVFARSDDGTPLIIGQQYGAGRSMAVALDTTWQWALSTDDTADLQKRFWRQVMLWAGNPSTDAWLTTDSPRYDAQRLSEGQERITVTAGVEDGDGTPRGDLPITITLAGEDGNAREINMEAAGDIRKAVLGSLLPGKYTLELSGQNKGKKLAAKQMFEVIRRDLERLGCGGQPLAPAADGRCGSPLRRRLRGAGRAARGAYQVGGYPPAGHPPAHYQSESGGG